MKKLMLATVMTASTLAAVAPAASASGGDMPSLNTHLGSMYKTKADCQKSADARKVSITKAGGNIDTSEYAVNNNNCQLSRTGWTYSTTYERPEPLSGDVVVGPGETEETAAKIADRQVAYFTHEYRFSDKASCVSAYNSVMAKLKANPNTVEVVPATNEEQNLFGYHNTFTCDAYYPAGKIYTYRITYKSQTNVKAPYGYENVETEALDKSHTSSFPASGEQGASYGYHEHGHTAADGTYVMDGRYDD